MEFHLYAMPRSCEMYLAALTAIQDYHKWLKERKIPVHVTVYCPNPSLDFLLPAVPQVALLIHTLDGYTTDKFDQVVDFNEDRAYKLSAVTEKHATQMFGIMLGSEPPGSLPDLSTVEMDPAVCDILVLPFPGAEAVHEFLENNKPELKCVLLSEALVESPKLVSGKLVVGLRSGLTYLASSLGRAVVEIYPPDRHRNWVSKWTSRDYQMIFGNPKDISPALVYRAVDVVWKRLLARERAMGVAVCP